ncbi:MAG: Fic family protein [Oligoflexia bacterium]|nr:Fic family protein [Oligoflexia bacterium]
MKKKFSLYRFLYSTVLSFVVALPIFLATTLVCANDLNETIEGCLHPAKELAFEQLFTLSDKMKTLVPIALSEQSQLDPEKIVIFPLSSAPILPYHYEQEIANFNELPLEQVVALLRNFHHDPVKNGLFGFYITADQKKVRLVKDINLIEAYKVAKSALQKAALTVEDIIKIRTKSEHFIYERVTTKSKQHKIKGKIKKFSWNQDNKSIVINSPLSDEVILRYQKMGYTISKYNTYREIPKASLKNNPYYFVPDDKPTTVYYSITFPRQEIMKTSLQNYVEKLNRMMSEKEESPEKIATFAVQELLIMHPFDDGNGRTARIIGQAIYEKLTGKSIVFPHAFHQELNYSEKELSQLISTPANSKANSPVTTPEQK